MKDDEDYDDPGFFRRNRWGIFLFAAVSAASGMVIHELAAGRISRPPKVENLTVVKLVPPLPLPPPPPMMQQHLPEPPQDQKMVEQTPVKETERRADPAPKDEPPASLGTGIAGPGADGFGLGRSGNGGGVGSGGLGSGRKGSRWGWYAGQVQSRIEQAIRNNRRTGNSAMQIEVRIWPDRTGRITRASLSGTTGDPALDAVLRNEVLTGLRLQEAPPEGMPTPIVMRLTARRPN